MPTQIQDPLIGRALEGRYRITSLLTRGGMSSVYVAMDERLDRLVAVKVMSDALSADPAFVERFNREARAAARLSHVNVVSVFDQGNDSGHAFLVMELVRGRTLRDLLRETRPLAPALAISIMSPVLAALAAAHRAGLVHRDVKPENILLADDGVVKVADFGLARAIEAERTESHTGVMMGTVAYCSPEQISQSRADARSDVYAAGVVLYELLTGEAPFRGATAMAVAYQHVNSRVPAPSDPAGPGRGLPIPRAVDALVLRATSREPAGRPADAGAMLAELHDARADSGLPIVAVPRAGARRAGAAVPAAARSPLRPHPQPGHDRTAAMPAGSPPRPGTAPMPPHGAGAAPPRGAGSIPPRGTGALPPRGTGALPPPAAAMPPRGTGALPPRGTGEAPARTAGARAPRRRRAHWRRDLLVLLAVLLVGGIAAYGSWWWVSGRYVTVPNVLNLSVDSARSTLSDHRLKADESPRSAFSETVPANMVISSSPSPGGRILPGKTVELVVSSGAERFVVPTIASQSKADATAALQGIPVQVVPSDASDDSVPAGQAIRTDPPAGAEVKRDQVITLYISTGPPVIAVPDVTTQTRAAAEAALQSAGFDSSDTEEYSDSVPEGAVIRQTPAGGASAVKFSTVTIVVSLGPELVTIPTIPSGTATATATATLKALGLVVSVHKNFGGFLDQVVGMDPPAGTKVRKGSTVTLETV